jgi:hypothetical protein
MKKFKLIIFSLLLFAGFSCTGDFEEINTSQTGFESNELSAKFFITNPQYKLYAPDRYPYWRAHLIHWDRFAGQFTFGTHGSWWNDGLGYSYSGGYTGATWGWMSGYFGSVKDFMDLTKEGAEFDNQYMYAMGLIMKSLYYQMFTDNYGMVSYTEAGVEGILTPKFDEQSVIYQGVINELDAAMNMIGSATATGTGVDDVGDNDLYCGGDLQQWKRLANTLKLRMALRALGAPGENFAATAINQALSAPLLESPVTMEKDLVIGQWGSAAYGDIWHRFGGLGSKWSVSDVVINYLQDNNDPRLSSYAKPADGGAFTFTAADAAAQERVQFILSTFDRAGADYTVSQSGDDWTIDVAPGQYIGQPVRLNGDIKPMARAEWFSDPSDRVNQDPRDGQAIYPEIIMTSAEAYFLQAEAAVRGMGSGDANALYQMGIRASMEFWGVGGGAIDTFLGTEAMGSIASGTMDEKLEKIAVQRWLNAYTDGNEAWAIVRDTGYPMELSPGVDNQVIYHLGTLNGDYPQRMRYGGGVQDNPNFGAVLSYQGDDVQATKLWFAK